MPSSIIIEKAGASAPWLAMVHGMSHDHRFFSAQTPCFESRYRIQLIDLPGHGMAASAPGPFGPEEYAAGVVYALDEAGADGVHYWGTHTGAGIGLLLAVRHPDRFRSLVLEAPVIPGTPPPYVATRVDAARRIAREHGVRRALEDWFEHSAWFEVINDNHGQCRAAEHRAMVMEFTGGPWLDNAPARPLSFEVQDLSRLRLPVLLINGERDHPDFVEVTDRLEAILPNAERTRIPEAGGFPAWEYPARVNPKVRRFLERID